MTLDPSFYINHLRRDSAAFLEAARRGSQPPLPGIPGCPGWNMGDLVLHLGRVHRVVGYRVRSRVRDFDGISTEDFQRAIGLDPPFTDWLNGSTPADVVLPPEVLTWFEEGATSLADALTSVSPQEPIGTWFPPNQTAGFWQRRMAHEIAVHRWDAQSAVGDCDPIDAALARDGIDEILDVMLPMRGDEGENLQGNGESYHFHATDGDGEWVVRFEPDGEIVTREHAKADLALRGTASDLMLFFWGRVSPEKLEILGDRALLDRYFELVPSD